MHHADWLTMLINIHLVTILHLLLHLLLVNQQLLLLLRSQLLQELLLLLWVEALKCLHQLHGLVLELSLLLHARALLDS